MIKITLQPLSDIDPTKSLIWKRWLTDCKKESKRVSALVETGEKAEFKQGLYRRSSIKSDYFFTTAAPFYGKCAYCEANIIQFQRGDVEHFRPKGAVTNEADDPVSHPGYYWLAYDVGNLLPACTICNQASTIGDIKIGKHSRFPVEGVHATEPGGETQEQPLLINPASDKDEDNPKNHLVLDTDTGIMGHHTARGAMCIAVFGLNLRDQLIDERQNVCMVVKHLVHEIINNPVKRSEASEKLKGMIEGKHQYSMAARTTFAQLRPSLAAVL
ncbi:MAG: hypothetical protein ACI8WB_002622 [Phenylobacterium sp.]|jgi:hypothetical protein